MTKSFLTILLITTLPFLSFADDIIKGKIINARTKQPVANANIVLAGLATGTSTLEDGTFTLDNLSNNQITLQITCLGYQPKKHWFDTTKTTYVEIELQPTSILLNTEVTVTATGKATSAYVTPEATTIVDKQNLLTNAPQSTAESLMGAAGVWMQKTNHGGGSPFVRGLTGNQALILLDGIRLNNSTFRYGPNQYFNTIDIHTVEQMEIIRGSGSTLYGSDALGGVINVLTNSTRLVTEKSKTKGVLGGKLMTHDMEQSAYGKGIYQSQRFSVVGSVSYSNFGDIYAGKKLGYEKPSSYHQYGMMLKTTCKITEKSTLTASFQRLNQLDINRFDQVAQREYEYYKFDPQIHQIAYLKGVFKTDNNLFHQLSFTVAHQLSDEKRSKKKQKSEVISKEHDEVNTMSFLARVHSRYNDRWTSISGLDIYYDKVHSNKKEIDLQRQETVVKRGLYPDDSAAESYALFSKHTIAINNRAKVNVGARYNLFNLQSKDEKFGDVQLTPSSIVGDLSYQYFFRNTQLILSANSAFRAPNINDISSFGSFDYGIEIPSKDLKPEKTYTAELGLKHRSNNFSLSLFVFNT